MLKLALLGVLAVYRACGVSAMSRHGASLRFLAFATVKCGGWDPFAFERWQCGVPADNVVGTARLGNGV